MKIKSSRYAVSAVKAAQYPHDNLPEIALAGRSNVGKSSLINCLLHRKNLARTSSSPGKTQTLNFYLVNQKFYLVDVPGYGFAKVSKQQRAQFGVMIQDYLETRADLLGLIILLDARHQPTKDDQAMYEYAQYLHLPILIVLTKVDKLKKRAAQGLKQALGKVLDLSPAYVSVQTFSAVTGLHRPEILAWIEEHLQ